MERADHQIPFNCVLDAIAPVANITTGLSGCFGIVIPPTTPTIRNSSTNMKHC